MTHGMNDNTMVICTSQEYEVLMQKVPQIPQIIGTPYHLREGNVFRGDVKKRNEQQRRYEKNREDGGEKARSNSREEAEWMGLKVVEEKSLKSDSLKEMTRANG